MSSLVGSVLFVVAIAAAIALHEWGHFWTARRFGMRAEKYFIGFGPTIWSTRKGETEYGVKWFPLGGFVRIAGMSHVDERQRPVADEVLDPEAVAADRRATAEETGLALDVVPGVPDATWQRLSAALERRGVHADDRDWLVAETLRRAGGDATPAEVRETFTTLAQERLVDTGRVSSVRHRVLRGDAGRFFHDRPAWQRAIVLSAGSAMHFFIAIVTLFVAFWAFGIDRVPRVEAVLEGSPAAEAGLQPGDEIVAVAGEPVEDFGAAKERIEARKGEPITLTVEREGGATRELTLTTALQVTELAGDSTLVAAGVQPGDVIVSVGGETPEGVDAIAAAGDAGGEVPLTVERFTDASGRGELVELTVPADRLDELADSVRGLAGFVPATEGMGPIQALEETFTGEGGFPAMVVGTFQAIGTVFGPEGIGAIPAQLTGEAERDPAGGASLVGITVVAGQGTAQAGLFFLLGIIASLNVFVGIFNILPLPPLDGGHLAVLGVERTVNAVRSARGKPADYRVDPRTVTAIAIPVIVFVGLVALAFLVLDITNPLQLPQ